MVSARVETLRHPRALLARLKRCEANKSQELMAALRKRGPNASPLQKPTYSEHESGANDESKQYQGIVKVSD